jgi:glucoamylase
LPETLVTDVTLRNDYLGIELVIHDAVEFFLWVYLREITVRDLTNRAREVRVFFNQDFHICATEVGDTAYYDPRTNAIIHYKESRYFLINIFDGIAPGVHQFATGTKELNGLEGTWRDAEDGNLSGNPIAQGSVDSTIGVTLQVPKGGAKTFYYWMCFGLAYTKVAKLNEIIIERGADKLLRRTKNYWRLWVNKENLDFQDLSPELVNLYKQSLLIVRTQIDDHGAIIAANDQDITEFARDTYSYMWPRDGALVAYAMTKAGYREVSHQFFQFCLELIGEDGYFLHKYNPDKTVGSSWHPWMRDGHLDVPIQEDETALVVWSLWKYFERFRDVEFIRPLFRRLISNSSDFMVAHRDAQTKLPLPCYDLWEERHGVHLFTVASVIGGLESAAKFSAAFGEIEQQQRYLVAAQEIRQAMLTHMWNEDQERFCRMATRTDTGYDLDMTIDASMFALFAFGALPVDDPRVTLTMQSIREKLWVNTSVGGVARYTNDYYHRVSCDIKNVPGNPWFICTMWLAQYEIAKAQSQSDLKEALKMLNWVAKSALPSGVLAEQVDPYTGQPLSVSPLTWSHASFIMCVVEYLEKRAYLSFQ